MRWTSTRNTASAGGLRGLAGRQPAAGGDAQEQLSGAAATVLPRQRPRNRRQSGRAGLPQRLGAAQRCADGRELRVRAFGSRVLHIPAGNGGLVSAVTILRSVITRRDASSRPRRTIRSPRSRSPARWPMSPPTTPSPSTWRSAYWKGGDAGGRGSPLPARTHRKDRRLGRVGVGQARHPLHPAGPGAHRAGPRSAARRSSAPRRSPTTRPCARWPAAPRSTSAWPTRKAAPTPGSSTCSAAPTPQGWPTPTGSAK